MISSCANPACKVPLNYPQGKLFRFHKAHHPDQGPPNTHSVQHFWLCGKCSLDFTLVYADERGVLLQDRAQFAVPPEKCQVVAAA